MSRSRSRKKRMRSLRREAASNRADRGQPPSPPAEEIPHAWDSISPRRALSIALAIAALALTIPLWILHVRGSIVVWDAEGYRGMADRMLESGFLSAANPYRTYGYPLFVAACEALVGRQSLLVPAAVVAGQMLVLLGAAALAAVRLAPSARPGMRLLIFASVALHPFVLPQASEQLTEVLGAALLLIAVALLLASRPAEPEQSPLPQRIGTGRAFVAMLVAGASVAVRPANSVVVIALGGLLALYAAFRRVRVRVVLAGAVAAFLPLVPQLVSNVRAFDRATPLVVERLYGFHLVEGTRLLKYTTSIAPGTNPHVEYASPWHDPRIAGPAEFLRRRPLRYLATLALHAFALVDWDLAFSYNRTVAPVTRWFGSPIGFVALFLAGIGLLPMFRAARHSESARWNVAILASPCLAIAALYVPTVVENRFSLPIYVLLAPSSALGAASLWNRWREGTLRRPGRLVALIAVIVVVSLWVSLWIASHARLLPA